MKNTQRVVTMMMCMPMCQNMGLVCRSQQDNKCAFKMSG